MVNEKYLNDRIILLNSPIEDKNASEIVSQLIYLNDLSKDSDIYLLIDSPGGSLTAGFAIYDTMRWCQCSINTVCLGISAGFASIILSAGTKGKRYMFRDSFYTPTLHISGKGAELYNQDSKVLNNVVNKTIQVYADVTNNDFEVMKLACTIDHSLLPSQALSKGYVDNVINEDCRGSNILNPIRHSKLFSIFKNVYYTNTIKKLKILGVIK